MSMMGRFVSISPDRLQQIIEDPSDVEELFAGEQVAKALPKFMGPGVQERLRALSPQMLSKAMETMHPSIRDRLAQSLKNIGIDPDALARGEQGDDLAKLMAQRMQALGLRMQGQTPPAQTPPGAGARSPGRQASLSIDKAWHGLHYLLCGKADSDSSIAGQAVMGGTEVGDDLGYGPARYFDAAQVADIARELTRPTLEAEMNARFDPVQMSKLELYPGHFDASDKQWLFDAFRQVRQFFVDASAAKLAVVTCLE